MIIEVTQSDIDTAIANKRAREDGYFDETMSCPIALAFQRVTNSPYSSWGVSEGTYRPIHSLFDDLDTPSLENKRYYALPEYRDITTETVANFDDGKYQELFPFVFEAVIG